MQQGMAQPVKHTGLGTAGLVLGLLALIFTGLGFIIPFIILVGLILGILGTIFGAIAFWGKWKDSYGLAGFIMGLISIILFVVILIIGIIFVAAVMSY